MNLIIKLQIMCQQSQWELTASNSIFDNTLRPDRCYSEACTQRQNRFFDQKKGISLYFETPSVRRAVNGRHAVSVPVCSAAPQSGIKNPPDRRI